MGKTGEGLQKTVGNSLRKALRLRSTVKAARSLRCIL